MGCRLRIHAYSLLAAVAAAVLGGCTDNELSSLTPDIAVSPEEIDFGTVALGTTPTVVLDVANWGGATLTVDSVVMADGTGPFAVEDFAGTLAPEYSVELAVTFSPIDLGPAEDLILVASDDPDEPVVEVPVYAVDVIDEPDIEVAPTLVDFGNLAPETTAESTVTITNVGSADLQLIDCVPNGDPAFTVESCPDGLLLAPSEFAEMVVSFTPHELIQYAGTVDVLSDDPDEPSVPVDLRGGGAMGTPPSATITSPINGAVIASTFNHDLSGTVYDVEDPLDTLLAEWSSDLDGSLATPQPDVSGDASIGPWPLSPGVHELTLFVEDSDGMTGHDYVTVTVCEMAANGTLQVENGGHIQATITSTSASATNRLYIVQPVTVTMTLDANNDVGVHVDMGYFDPCTQIVLRLESSVDGYVPHDSNNSGNFQITQTAPNAWSIGVEDGADSDYNDIVIDVLGGI